MPSYYIWGHNSSLYNQHLMLFTMVCRNFRVISEMMRQFFCLWIMKRSQRKKTNGRHYWRYVHLSLSFLFTSKEHKFLVRLQTSHSMSWCSKFHSQHQYGSNYPVFIYSSIWWSSTQLWAYRNDTWLHTCTCRKLNDTPNSLWCRNPSDK